MILLGAGASQPFGIPTLQTFSNHAIDKLKDLGNEKIVFEIETALIKFGMTLDFESLYSILEGLKNPIESVQKAGPLMAYFLKNTKALPKKYDYNNILLELRRIIYDKCIINKDNYSEVRRCYDKLWKSLNSMRSVEGSKLVSGKMSHDINRVFITTNYDMSLESYLNEKNIQIIDGYRIGNSPYVKYFDPSTFINTSIPNTANMVLKLHGSIWQFIRNNELIKTTIDPISNNIPYEINVEKEMMIYPTKEKDILNHQYFPFYTFFKNWEWTKLLAIGFSFRDDPINSAIIENLVLNKDANLIVLNPHPDDVINNLTKYSSSELVNNLPTKRIHKIQGYFGKDDTYEKIFELSNTLPT